MQLKQFISSLLLLLCLTAQFAKADTIYSGNISYSYVNDSTYTFTFKFYRLCLFNNIEPLPNSIDLCFYNDCTNSRTTIPLPLVTGLLPNGKPNGSEIVYSCGENKTTCAPTFEAGQLLGAREYWYSKTIELPLKCNWKFYVSVPTQIGGANLANKGDMHIETSFSNIISSKNSSPQFSFNPIYFIPQSANWKLNNTAFDADGDSLVTTLVMPRISAHCSSVVHNNTFSLQTPPLNLTTNPLACNNTFVLDAKSGDMTFKQGPPSAHVSSNYLAFRIDEYRNGQLIGSVNTNLHVRAILTDDTDAAPSFTPIVQNITGATWSNGQLNACIGTPMQMCFDIKTSNKNSVLTVSDDMAKRFPGAYITYSQHGDSVRGCLNWTPTKSVNEYAYIYIKDIACNTWPGTSGYGYPYFHSTNSFKVYVPPPLTAGMDTTICPGEAARLHVNGGNGSFEWSLLQGGTPTNLSCINCKTPFATPTAHTSYKVKLANNICPNNKNYLDTVNVIIAAGPFNQPKLTLTNTPGNVVSSGTSVRFFASVISCNKPAFRWYKNSVEIPGQFADTFVTNNLQDGDEITCRLICNDYCPQPRNQLSSAIKMQVTNNVEAITKAQPKIIPNPNNGSFQVIIDDISLLTSKATVLNTIGQVIHTSSMTDSKTFINLQQPPGVYIIKITAKDKIWVSRLVIQ